MKEHETHYGRIFSISKILRYPYIPVLSFPYDGPMSAWGPWETCPVGGWAVQHRVQIQPPQGIHVDDTGLNSVELICNGGGERVTSSLGPEGEWSEAGEYCEGGFSGVKVSVETMEESSVSC